MKGWKEMDAWKLMKGSLFFNQIPNISLKAHFRVRIFSCHINKARLWIFPCVKEHANCQLPLGTTISFSNSPLTLLSFYRFLHGSLFLLSFDFQLLSLILELLSYRQVCLIEGKIIQVTKHKMPKWLPQKSKVRTTSSWTLLGCTLCQLSVDLRLQQIRNAKNKKK